MRFKLLLCLSFLPFITLAQQEYTSGKKELKAYREELRKFRGTFGGSIDMPDVPFFLFGMGNRQKYIYRHGKIIDAKSGKTVKEWNIEEELILPPSYSVLLKLKDSKKVVVIMENEKGIWIKEGSKVELLANNNKALNLPNFKEYRYPLIMKVLHQEILINIIDSKPLPNYLVYNKPWRRDGAMMAMCLKNTGNLNLIKDWVLGLDDPYDRNNAGETEADNLGQTLYLISLFSDKSFPLVTKILNEAKKYEVKDSAGLYIKGRSDFHEAPAYQTKWMKFGLKSLGLEDPYSIPSHIADDYSSLFWWDYKLSYKPGTIDAWDQWKNPNYAYIGWAADHFHGLKRNFISNRDYPLTWEKEASQANYNGMKIVDPVYETIKLSVPHTWHASEVFLYIKEMKK